MAALQTLPLQAQSVISSSLGTPESAFAARRSGGGYVLNGGGIVARLGAGGVEVRAGGVSVPIRLVAGHRALSMHSAANRVVLDRGSVQEWYAAGPLGIEQGFTLARRSAGSHRTLSLRLAFGGPVKPALRGSTVRLVGSDGRVVLRYGGLSAVDARGRQLRVGLGADGRAVVLRVWDRNAVYPLRIDPLIQQGGKLTPSDEVGSGSFGYRVALSQDGTTA